MNELPYLSDASELQKALHELRTLRREAKLKNKTRYFLSKGIRQQILEKTNGKCHVCGIALTVDKFEADHVKSRAGGGSNTADNFLPACRTCNNYRWHYLPQEINWILKLGIWAKTEIQKDTSFGKDIGNKFIAYERSRERRRKNPREQG